MIEQTRDHSWGTLTFCAWNGMIFMTVFGIFWGLCGHNLPPFPGDTPAAVIAGWYRANHDLVRLGMVMSMTFTVSYAVWGISLGRMMDHVLGRGHILTELQVWGAGLTVVPVLVSSSMWLAASYRVETLTDQNIQMLYDMAWLLIDLAYSVTSVQMIALGAGCLRDRRAQPIFPKWVCWYSIWVGFMFVAECLMPYFKAGPFNRSGVLNYWIEFGIFYLYAPILTYYQLRGIKRLRAEAGE